MASGGPIDRQDIITDEALKAPGIMTEELQKMIDMLDGVVKKSQEYATSFTATDASTAKMKESTSNLSEENKLLVSTMDKIHTELLKQEDGYQSVNKLLQDAKQQTKEKTQLGDREAESINRQNASIRELGAALNANRVAYSNLRSEQERNSKSGKELLETIQAQDKAFKDLKTSMGQEQEKVGAYQSEIGELIGKFGELGEMGEKGIGLVTTAAGSLFGVLAAGVAIITGLAKAYTESAAGAKDFEEAETRASNSFAIFSNLIGGASKGEGEGPIDKFFRGAQAGGLALFAIITGDINAAELLDQAIQKAQKSSTELVELKFKDLEIQHELNTLQLEANVARGETNDPDKNKALEAANKYVDALRERMVLERSMQDADAAALLKHELAVGNDILSEKNITDQKYQYLQLQNQAIETQASNQRMLDRALKTQASITAELQKQNDEEKKKIDAMNEADDKALKDLIINVNAHKNDKPKEDKWVADPFVVDYEKMLAEEIKKGQEDWQKYLDNKANATKLYNKKEEELTKERYGLEAELARSSVAAINSILSAQFIEEEQQIQSSLNSLQEKYKADTAAAGDNADAKKAIDEQYAKDQKRLNDELLEIKRKQAIFDKTAAILDIGIKTAQAVAASQLQAHVLASNPATAALAAMALAQIPIEIGIGAAQIAAVAAKPLPSYLVGTSNHPGGLAQVGEGGAELYLTPSGLAGLTPGHSSIMNLPQGTQVFSNEVTRMLALQGLGIPERLDRPKQLETQVVRELRQTNKLLSRRRESVIADGVAIIQVHEAQEAMINRIRSNVMIG